MKCLSVFGNLFLSSARPTLRDICTKFRLHSPGHVPCCTASELTKQWFSASGPSLKCTHNTSKGEICMEMLNLEKELKENAYPGRGIIIGKSADGTKAVAAYFIMGRSENSRNRIFVEEGEGIRTQAFDPAKLSDPSLIIYAPVRVLGNKTIVTNGDQTDTIYEGMDKQLTFEQSLRSREFEPDGPNYTPRISGIMLKLYSHVRHYHGLRGL